MLADNVVFCREQAWGERYIKDTFNLTNLAGQFDKLETWELDPFKWTFNSPLVKFLLRFCSNKGDKNTQQLVVKGAPTAAYAHITHLELLLKNLPQTLRIAG